MAYPQKLLGEHETVVLDLHPHWKVMFLPFVELLALLALAGFLLAQDFGSTTNWSIIGVGVLLLLGLFVVPLLKWRTTHFVVTSERVVMRSGVLGRSGRDIPLARINDVSFQHTFFERLLGCGTLVVESAGERGQVTLTEIPKVEKVQRVVYDLVDKADDPQPPTSL
ncbi:MAG: rane-flanked domain [Frankiales bacterium]|nr:rane-flanked domain [Frankiales bacterium]